MWVALLGCNWPDAEDMEENACKGDADLDMRATHGQQKGETRQHADNTGVTH